MNAMLNEIEEMPARAMQFLSTSETYTLPHHVPYIGMGSSYFAPLAFKYMGFPVQPEIASEYFNYAAGEKPQTLGVILSQSGRSSEALWCRELFDRYIAISNDPDSALCTAKNVQQVVALHAGKEDFSSSKTYINALLSLFRGMGLNAAPAVEVLVRKMQSYKTHGQLMASEVDDLRKKFPIHGIYVTGSGPNIATAMQAALIMSESTKLDFHGLPMAQYDHGPKETARNSIVIQIVSKGKSSDRAASLSHVIRKAGAHVFIVEEPEVEEKFSVINNVIPFNFMAYYLAEKLGVGETFSVGGKVTEVK